MKNFSVGLLLAAVSLATASQNTHACKGCGAGKLMLQCDYYVARKGDVAKRHFCAEYAKVVDIEGASAKAAWYYLLAGEPDKALDAALRAVKVGQDFAAGYAAQALAAMGDAEEAKRYVARFRRAVKERGYFEKEVATLSRLYPDKDFSCLE